MPYNIPIKKESLPRGKILPEAEDKKYGRWWQEQKDKRRPILYSRIGQPCRPEHLRISLLFGWQKHTPNWKRVIGEAYRKRWPGYKELSILFFAEFALKEWSRRSLSETCARLPFFGVGSVFQQSVLENARIKETKPKMVLRDMDYRIRPFESRARADYFSASGALIRHNISPIGKHEKGWIYSFPANADPRIYRPPFPPPHNAPE